MGAERSSTTRMRLSGQICCACKIRLPAPHIPGERHCDRCRPPLKTVYVSFEKKLSWHLIFFDNNSQRRLCHLIFADDHKIVELAKRSGALKDLADKQALEMAIVQGKGGLFLKLTSEQYIKLGKGKR